MGFVYCLNTSTIEPQPVMEKIRLAAKHGFAGIELWHNDIFEYVEQGGTVDDVNKAVADAGLIVPSTIAMKGWCEASAEEYPERLEDVRRRMDLAAHLGSSYVIATPAHVVIDYAQIVERFVDLLEIGRQIGVKPVMEYLGFCPSVFKVTQALKICEATGGGEATIVLDAFHNFRGGSTFEELKTVPLDRIAHYHLNDAPADPPREEQRDPNRVMPGDGILDLKSEIDWLREIGYEGTVSLELFNRDLWKQDPDDVLAVGMERMKQLLE
jgi:2-keto-myo-inositol isomerase